MPSKSVRNNNPGNIRDSRFARRRGAPDTDGDGMANFPTSAQGFKGLMVLLGCNSYRYLSIEDALARYAPAADGNPVKAYVDYVCCQTGLSPNQELGLLSCPDLAAMAWAIAMFEGWQP